MGKLVVQRFVGLIRLAVADPALDLLRGLPLHGAGDVAVDVNRRSRRDVADDGGERFHVHAVLQGGRGEGVPLRYNYDKPEKPRISRVFGYLARFFILFQTEKSSREVVIS